MTQIANPAAAPEAPVLPRDLSQKLLEASLEEQSLAEDEGETGPPPPVPSKPPTPASRASGPEPRPPARVETLREEVPTDLRVFELNSDSGKSTPSNNGKKGRSGGQSTRGSTSGASRSCHHACQCVCVCCHDPRSRYTSFVIMGGELYGGIYILSVISY